MKAKNITVSAGRISYVVQLAEGERYTSPELMVRVLKDFPRLEQHACINAKGPLFGCVMNHTSRAHLLEHMVIDLQASAHAYDKRGAQPLFVGNTQWVREDEGLARVQVNYLDDLVALRAFRQALDYLNAL